jgi:hypothetical protein
MPGGRPKGSKDRPRRALYALLQEKYPGFDAVLEMVKMYHESEDRAERERLLNSIAPYLTPKLKSVEVQAEGQFDAVIRWGDPHTLQSEATPGDST